MPMPMPCDETTGGDALCYATLCYVHSSIVSTSRLRHLHSESDESSLLLAEEESHSDLESESELELGPEILTP